jgi:hypothetical protein
VYRTLDKNRTRALRSREEADEAEFFCKEGIPRAQTEE